MSDLPKELTTELRKFGDEEIEVIFRKTQRPEQSEGSRNPPLLPYVTVENGIRYERDVAVPLRDGTIIYIDIYRPDGVTNLPTIISWSPGAKRRGYATTTTQLIHGVSPGTVSRMAMFEASDPAYWCHYGYTVINADARGSGNSQGDITSWCTQEGRDCADLVEWLATRDWSNGKVGMSGNSAVAMVQWFTAAEKPSHLTCIAPWEGCSDMYREFFCWGGFPEVGFNERLISVRCGLGRIEDCVAMSRKYTLMNAYWEDKIVRFDDIEIPTYITAGWCHFHLRGSIGAFRQIASPKKWLRVHRDFEWPDAYSPENLEDLRRFFDRYLKDIRNGWEMTPRVRLDVMDAGDIDYQVKRPEKEFPLARTQYAKLFLDANTSQLSRKPVKQESSVSYSATEGTAMFDIRFEEDTELTGYIKLRLWVEADGADDMDLFVAVQKLDEQGNFVPAIVLSEPHPGAAGKLRVSHRELDEERSTPYQPYHTHRREQLLKPKEIVPVEIEIWPYSMLWHTGQQLRVAVSGHYERKPGWFEPFLWETRNRGTHIIHTGGKYDSHLLVPVIPPKYMAGTYVYR
ncbi:CocE/NonD family hydrolase [Chloroflexota bacterium]